MPSARTHARERKVRRPRRSVPPETLRPTTSRGRRTSSLLLVPRGVPPCESPFPSIGLSPGRPPPNDLHREDAVDDFCVLCTGLVASWDGSGCSRVARSGSPAIHGKGGRFTRREATTSARGAELCGSRRDPWDVRVPDAGGVLDTVAPGGSADLGGGGGGPSGIDRAHPPARPPRPPLHGDESTESILRRERVANMRRDQGNWTCPAL